MVKWERQRWGAGLAVVALGALAGLAGPAAAGKAHQHGVATLDVAVDGGRLTIELDTPLDNLLGFERAPRTDVERARAAAAVARLQAGDALFRIDPAAGCTLAQATLTSAALGLGARPAAARETGEHGDLEAVYSFECKAGARAGFVEVGLFEAFASLKRIELQVVTPKGQVKATLRRPASRVVLVR